MAVDNAFATHPGKAAEAAERINEDFAHAWVKDGVNYQIAADGNHRTEFLNPAPFVVNEIQRLFRAADAAVGIETNALRRNLQRKPYPTGVQAGGRRAVRPSNLCYGGSDRRYRKEGIRAGACGGRADLSDPRR